MKQFLFMMAKGNASVESSQSITRYIGTGVVKVLCVNPTKDQIKEHLGYEPKEEPVYTGLQTTQDGEKIPYFRVSFVIRTTPEKSNNIDTTQILTYFVRKEYIQGSQSGKYLVADNYCNTAWGTEEEIEAKKTIQYSNGPAKLIGSYRRLYNGERQLLRFFQEFLVIGSSKDTSGYDYVNGTWVPMGGYDLANCECYFTEEELNKMFKGDFSPIKNSIALQPNNEVRVLFGINSTTDSNGNAVEYQDIYTRPLRLRISDWKDIQKEIEDAKNRGGLKNRIYDFCDLKEYKPVPTELNAAPVSDLPFGDAPTGPTPW